jgi:formylglycine-generating enzyme required for sulfatase activity
MIQDVRLKWFLAIVVPALPAAAAQAEMIETVPVGNRGNVGEQSRLNDGDTTNYGGVNCAYNIGKYEVTAGQYAEFLNAVAATDTYGLYNDFMWLNTRGCKIHRTDSLGSYRYIVAEDWANRPVNYVSWGDAARFANWLHNGHPTGAQDDSTTEDGAYYLNGTMSQAGLMAVSRKADWKWAIPTEDEWYKAAYHKIDGDTGNYFDYPTSSDSRPSNDLVDPDLGNNNATFYDSGWTVGTPYYRTEIGAHEKSKSPYGTFDQGGNVSEWNETPIGAYRGVRGGSFRYGDGDLRASARDSSNPTVESRYIGFRVVSSVAAPEPGSLAMLAGLAVMGLIWWRRRR